MPVLLSLVCLLAASTASALIVTPTHMLGPNSPAFADTNNDGAVTPADTPMVIQQTGPTTVTLVGAYANNPALNLFTLSNPVGGKFHTVGRAYGSGTQDVTVTGFTGLLPTQFTMKEIGSHGTFTGVITLQDTNSDGIYDNIHATGRGGAINIDLPFVYVDSNHDGYADFISVPWGMANLAGVNFNNKVNGFTPQVWVPLADTNGDGRGDTILFDLDGNNAPDSDVEQPPGGSFGPVAAPSSISNVPTLSEWGVLLTVLVLGAAGFWQLRNLQAKQTTAAV